MIAFVAGLVFELSYLAWIYFADRGWPLRTAGMSMFVGYVSITGLTTVVHDAGQTWFLLLGYGAGSYVAARWKQWASRSQPARAPQS